MQDLDKNIKELTETIARLRDPNGGCPWDLEQDFETLRTYMIEEAYEASEAMAQAEKNKSPKNTESLCDELGDVLLQVVLNAQIASERKLFDLANVAKNLNDKMIRRHPHVFAEAEIKNVDELYEQWDSIKAKENGDDRKTKSKLEQKYSKLRSIAPPSKQAVKIGKLTHKVGFDWKNPSEVFDKVKEEVGELADALESQKHKDIKSELGDLFFSLFQLCRHLDVDPEIIAQNANQKFLGRFDAMLASAGMPLDQFKGISTKDKEALWEAVKKIEG